MLLGALGQRENDAGRGTTRLSDRERPIVSRQALTVAIQSALIALAATAVVWFL